MKKFTVNVQVIKLYCIEVSARNEEEAETKALEMPQSEIEANGNLINAENDFATVV